MVPEAHILVVDDDQRLRELLSKFLRREGFLTTTARDGEQACKLLEGLSFDLIVMDVMMPGEDGISLCARLRAALSVPVILLTARGETDDRISGLEAGADDYLVKPFDPKELVLRIAAVLRRAPQAPKFQAPKRHFGARTYDPQSGVIEGPEGSTQLTSAEVQLLDALVQHAGKPLSREALCEVLSRNGAQVQQRTVDVQVARLRRKIEDDLKQPRFLKTVRGEGYALFLT